eukprot:gene3888-13954_t
MVNMTATSVALLGFVPPSIYEATQANLFTRPVAMRNGVAQIRTTSSVSLMRMSRSAIKAQQQTDPALDDDDGSCDYIASDYCGIDPETGKKRGRRTVGEMEKDFLGALGSYYYEGKSDMPDDEFNLLKEVCVGGIGWDGLCAMRYDGG